MQHETNAARIKARLLQEGWQQVPGSKHDKFRKPDCPTIMVPRHRTVTSGMAQSIANAAGRTK